MGRASLGPLVACAMMGALAACGEDSASDALEVAWTFEGGEDCVALAVETVEVTATGSGGEVLQESFPCEAGIGTVGTISTEGERYSIALVGRDADGNLRVETFGVSVAFSGGVGGPVEVTLRPAEAPLVVTWGFPIGGGCPGSVVLPYHITVFEAGTETRVDEQQESCRTGEISFEVPPGDYDVELDSRAVTPAVQASGMVTVVPVTGGELSLSL